MKVPGSHKSQEGLLGLTNKKGDWKHHFTCRLCNKLHPEGELSSRAGGMCAEQKW